jgi:hypothetical protein
MKISGNPASKVCLFAVSIHKIERMFLAVFSRQRMEVSLLTIKFAF